MKSSESELDKRHEILWREDAGDSKLENFYYQFF